MRPVLTSAQMRALESKAVERKAATVEEMMERAGAAVASAASRIAPSGRVVVLAGGGNNGGDGWVAARVLHEQGRDVRVIAAIDPERQRGPAAQAAKRALRAGVVWERVESDRALEAAMRGASLLVDAVLGIGVAGSVREPVATILATMAAADGPVLAVDVPSGVDADTGALLGPAPRAVRTVTFTALKPGLLIYPGAAHAGEIEVADVGLSVPIARTSPRIAVWDLADYAARLPLPTAEAHKGERGRVLIVAGSRLYAGAAILAAAGAMRMGAGYVFAAVPASIVPVMQAALPHVIAVGLSETPEGSICEEAVEHVARLAREVDAAVVGPGLTTHAPAVASVRRMLPSLDGPLVLDADALNALEPRYLEAIRQRAAPTVITPHPGELARLSLTTAAVVQSDRLRAAMAASGRMCACLLKGARTVVACDEEAVLTLAGNPGMATAGMGDVLAGMVGTLLAQGLAPLDAAALAAFVHAKAGDLAAAELTEICLTSKDLPAYIPAAVREVLGVLAAGLG